MSASLVGSEMCIRDSAGSEGLVLGDQQPPCLEAVLLRHRLHEGERLAPVSYTHLTLPTICSV
eukprot:9233214-Alexandrium_andersonii.AAC.1